MTIIFTSKLADKWASIAAPYCIQQMDKDKLRELLLQKINQKYQTQPPTQPSQTPPGQTQPTEKQVSDRQALISKQTGDQGITSQVAKSVAPRQSTGAQTAGKPVLRAQKLDEEEIRQHLQRLRMENSAFVKAGTTGNKPDALPAQEAKSLTPDPSTKAKPKNHIQEATKPAKETKRPQPKPTQPIPVSQSTPVSQSAPKPAPSSPVGEKKPPAQLPKLSLMNNLIRLSTKLPGDQMLKQLKYKGTVNKITPIKLLFYFAIEYILYRIHAENGSSLVRRKEKEKDVKFLKSEIMNAVMGLVTYLSKIEMTMVWRVMFAVYTRLGIAAHISNEEILAEFRKRSKSLEAFQAEILKSLELGVSANKITAAIFSNVPLLTQPRDYGSYNLSLEDERAEIQRIENPEQYHENQRLFFFNLEKPTQTTTSNKSSSVSKSVSNYSKPLQQQTLLKKQPMPRPSRQPMITELGLLSQPQLPSDVVCMGDRYNTMRFTIQPKVFDVPKCTKVLLNPNNSSQFEIVKAPKIKMVSVEASRDFCGDEAELEAKKRPRPPAVDELSLSGGHSVSRESLMHYIEEYLQENTDEIAYRIAKKEAVRVSEVKQAIRQAKVTSKHNSPLKSEVLVQKTLAPRQEKKSHKKLSEKQILKQLQQKVAWLESKKVPIKEIIKQITIDLENMNLTSQVKNRIIQQWIELHKKSRDPL